MTIFSLAPNNCNHEGVELTALDDYTAIGYCPKCHAHVFRAGEEIVDVNPRTQPGYSDEEVLRDDAENTRVQMLRIIVRSLLHEHAVESILAALRRECLTSEQDDRAEAAIYGAVGEGITQIFLRTDAIHGEVRKREVDLLYGGR
jgi:hypothetical protein